MVKISAGSHDLNTWLHGGYETDIVTVFYGAAGTGKTNFCMQAAISQAKKGNTVVYIDTEGGFSVERARQMVNGSQEFDPVLEKIKLLKPTNFTEQEDSFNALAKYLKDETISLIIIDGMTILYRLEFAAAKQKGEKEVQQINAALARQMKTLVEIARKRSIPVLTTNQVYRWEDSNQMVGGDILKYWGKCLIELENDIGRRAAHLQKHRSLPQSSFQFSISDEGIKKRGWI